MIESIGRCARSLHASAIAIVLLAGVGFTSDIARASAILDSVAGYDFVRFGGTVYERNQTPAAGLGRSLTEGDIGPEFTRVRWRAEPGEDPCELSYDGTAGDLDDGTPVYEVVGYDPRFRLAARRDQDIVLFEATCSFTARSGSDVLDLRGKVTRIAVYDDSQATLLGTIDEPQAVADLVDMILNASVHFDPDAFFASVGSDGVRFWVVFHFADGTASKPRAFFPRTGEMWYGLDPPDAFEDAIQAAIRSGTPIAATPLPITAAACPD